MKPTNSPTPEPGDLVELTIDSLSYFGGRGVGRTAGVVVFVPQTAPGDRIRARITERKPRFLEAELVEILEPSPSRRTPPCPVAGRCGGCSWQHITYAEQLRQKDKILRDSLRRLSGFELLPLVPAPEEFHYRNRIQVHLREGRAGFFAKRTRDLVETDTCWIAEPSLNEALRTLANTNRESGRVEIARGIDGETRVLTHERDPELALFSQVNTAQNTRLKRLVTEWVENSPHWIYDLYAGDGNLTTDLVNAFPNANVTAVEFSRGSVERGKRQLPKVSWFAGDVGRVLQTLKRPHGGGLMVLDPPRTGADRLALKQIQDFQPLQILYVSCNPTTFARDAEALSQTHALTRVQGLDMFPQTEHVELIATFSRR